MIVAIQPDDYGLDDASYPIWSRILREAGHEVREVNVHRADILEQINGCHGFMWRHGHHPSMRQIARRLLPVLEEQLDLEVYPDQKTCWHYDDKIAQAYLLQAAGIPTPKTWIWFEKEGALEWARHARYPLVLKLWAGAGSTNVRLIRVWEEARYWIEQLFCSGVKSLVDEKPAMRERMAQVKRVFLGGDLEHPCELHKNYVLFQEFLADNEFDIRITVIGDRAFGFRRFNRENDFRASGSGKIDHDPGGIDSAFIKIAFEAAKKLKLQSCAIDGLLRGNEPVIGEISYTYASWAVHKCPGHWASDLTWHEGQMWPEEAQIADFLVRLEQKYET